MLNVKWTIFSLFVLNSFYTYHNYHPSRDLIQQRWINRVANLQKYCYVWQKHVYPSHLLDCQMLSMLAYSINENQYSRASIDLTSLMFLVLENTYHERILYKKVLFEQGHKYHTRVSINHDKIVRNSRFFLNYRCLERRLNTYLKFNLFQCMTECCAHSWPAAFTSNTYFSWRIDAYTEGNVKKKWSRLQILSMYSTILP